MNSFLLSLGIAVALALVAAFAAPFFIDWSSHRTYFEARAARLIGRPVTFEGDLTVRIIPFPLLVADAVRIGGPGSLEGVERLDMRLALTPLLSGELDVTELTLTRPHAVLHFDTEGRVSWAAAGELAPPVSPDRVAIDRFQVVDGDFAIDDERSGRVFNLSGVNLEGSATSLLGPFKVEGGAMVDGERYSLRLATGRMAGDGSGIRLKASILPAARPVAIDLDGALLRIQGMPVFDGRLVVERPAAGEGEATWRLDGAFTASPDTLILDRMSIRLGSESENVSLSGAANVRLGAEPRFDAVISARQVDLDRVFGAGPDSPIGTRDAVARLAALLDPALFPVPGHLALDVESTVVSGGLLEGLSVDLEADGPTWSIERATVAAPGRTSLSLAGTIGLAGESPQFDGAVHLSTAQAAVFANWLLGPQGRLPGFLASPAGGLEASGQVSVDAGGLTFDRMDLRLGESRIEGSAEYRDGGDGARPALALALNAEQLDLSGASPGPVGGQAAAFGALEALLSGIDLEAELRIGTLSLAAITARDLTVSGKIADGDMRIDRLAIGDIGGARIDGGGEVRSYARAPDGTLGLDLSAQSLDGVVEALRALGASELADGLAARASALVPAEIAVDLAATRTDDGSRGRLAVSGTAGGSTLDGTFAYEGRIDDLGAAEIELSLSAENGKGQDLARQIGLPGAAAAPDDGQVSLSARGRLHDDLNFTLSAAGVGLEGIAEGTARWPQPGTREITSQVDVDIADAGSLLALAGIAAPAQALPIRLTGSLSGTGDMWRLSGLDISGPDARVEAMLTFDMRGPGRVLGGRIEADRIALPWLMASLVGAEAVRFPAVAYGEPAWPAAALAPAGRPGWRGRIELATPAFALLGEAVLTEAEATFTFDDTRMSLDGLRGNLFGGQFSADFDLTEADGVVALAGRLDLADGRLEEIVWKDSGRAVSSGRVSAGMEFDGRGRSLAAIVASLSGTGSFTIADGVLRRLNPSAFDLIVSAADAGLELTEDDVRGVFASHLDSGSLPFRSMEGAFAISSGVLRASNIRIDAQALQSFASATVDLPVLGLDSEWTLKIDDTDSSGRTREVGVVFAGPLAAPSRQIDVNPLLGYLTVRAFEREVERLETLQDEILERQRLGRELIRQGQERVRRERESQERQARAAADAERQIEEEQARRAEEDARRLAEEEQRAEELARQGEAAEAPPEPGTQSATPAPPPEAQPQGSGISRIDQSDFERRIQEILREIPSTREAPPPGGATLPPPPLTIGPPPAPMPGAPAPPLSPPLLIGPQPAAPVVVQPQTVIDDDQPGPPARSGADEPQNRIFR